MANEQQGVPELPKSRLGSRARVDEDSEAFERAGLRLLRFVERKKPEPPLLPRVTMDTDLRELAAVSKARLERLAIELAENQLKIAKDKALRELWISHEQWERATGRENIAKENPYARGVMTPDELQQSREQARLKYEKLYGVTVQDRSEHESRKVVHPAPVSSSRFELWWAKWSRVLIILAIFAALAMLFSLCGRPRSYPPDWVYPEYENPFGP